jgi:hypothetical protein
VSARFDAQTISDVELLPSPQTYGARQNRFIARRQDRGDNLSVRFYIRNSISLTIVRLPRIICATISGAGERTDRRDTGST